MKRILRVCAVLLLAALGTLYLATPADPPVGRALTVHDPDRDLGTLPVGKHTVSFRVTNASSLPLRVIGLSEA